MPEQGKVSFTDRLKKMWGTAEEVLGEIAYREGSKIEGVRQAVKRSGVTVGKNVLWKIFPFLIIGVVGLWAVTKG